MKINFFATAEFSRFTGYGKLEHGLIRGLDACGAEIIPIGAIAPLNFAALPLPLREKLVKPQFPADVTLVTALPENCSGWHAFGKKVWLFTMSESDKVSPDWVGQINDYCAGVFVPCEALVEIYRNSGVRVPVVNVDMGVDYELPPALDFAAQRLPTSDNKFIFLTYSYGDMRKGAHKAMLVFNLLFGGNPQFELWVKARHVRDTWLEGCVDPQIKIIEGEQSEAEWFDLLRQVDCFVFPSYGEGFGLPPREAVLCGVPAIATQALGMADVACWGYPLRVARWLPAQFEVFEANAEDAKWAEPNQQDLEERMAWIVTHRAEAYAHTIRGRDYLLNNFTWKRTAQKMLEVLNADYHPTANG